MYKGTVTIDELNSFKEENINTSENLFDEQSRLETIFNKIQNLIDEGKELSFHERKFFYYAMSKKSMQLENERSLFSDFYFIEIFYRYLDNLVGIKTKFPVDIKLKCFDEQMKYNLCSFYVYWKNEIIENEILYKEGDTLKNAVKKETNEMIKDLIKKDKKGVEIVKDYNSEHFRIVLFSKFIYLKSIEIIETFDNDKSYFEFNMNDNIVILDDKFLVHVLMRHYAHTMKISNFFKIKSHFIDDILPEKIHLFFKDIFMKYALLNSDKNIVEPIFDFKYKSQNYKICFEIKEKIRISSFFPLEEDIEITKLGEKALINFDETLLFYI